MGIFGIGSAISGTNAAIASIAGSIMSAQQARENRKWMERMSNSAHQREVKDLRKAGLNPILSATGGNGATTPTANTTADFSGLADGVAKGVNTAIAFRQQKNADRMTKAEVENKEADSYLKGNQAMVASEEFNNAIKQGQLFEAQTAKAINDLKIDNARLFQDIKESESRIFSNSANARYNNERSRGYSHSVKLPFGIASWSKSGNKLFGSKGTHIEYEYINGHRVPVKVYDD